MNIKIMLKKNSVLLITSFLTLFLCAYFLLNIINAQVSQSAQICKETEFAKLTGDSIVCSSLNDRTSNAHVSNITNTIINPVLTPIPENIPDCASINKRYVHKDGSWQCRNLPASLALSLPDQTETSTGTSVTLNTDEWKTSSQCTGFKRGSGHYGNLQSIPTAIIHKPTNIQLTRFIFCYLNNGSLQIEFFKRNSFYRTLLGHVVHDSQINIALRENPINLTINNKSYPLSFSGEARKHIFLSTGILPTNKRLQSTYPEGITINMPENPVWEFLTYPEQTETPDILSSSIPNQDPGEILFIGCPTGQFLNRVTSPIICGNSKTWHVSVTPTNTTKGRVATTNIVHANRYYSTVYYYKSDLTLKENLETLEKQLGKLNNINGYYFNFKDGDTKRRIGFIAQEIEKIYPELVSENKNGIKSVDYGAFLPILLESIKEAEQRVKGLEAKLQRKKQ